MNTMPSIVTPEIVLRLYRENPDPGERLSRLLHRAFVDCPDSRRHCAHLQHFFGETSTGVIRHSDLYLAHWRSEGARYWQRIQPLIHQTNGMEKVAESAWGARAELRWGLVEAMCQTSRCLGAVDRQIAFECARASLPLANAVPLGPLTAEARSELLALVQANIGNSFRCLDRTPEARSAFEQSFRHLEMAADRPLGHTALILSLRASVDISDRNYPQAIATLGEALSSLREEQAELHARIMLKRSSIRIYQRQFECALSDLNRTIDLLRDGEHPRLWCLAMQNRLLVATELGRWDVAETLVPEVGRSLRKLDDKVHLIRLRWSQARIALGRGRAAEAEDLYLQVREGFLHHQLAYNAALVTVELAQLLLEQGRLEQVKQYALETAAEFERQGVEPELIGAIALLEKAVLAQRLTVQLLARIQRQLQRYEGASRR